MTVQEFQKLTMQEQADAWASMGESERQAMLRAKKAGSGPERDSPLLQTCHPPVKHPIPVQATFTGSHCTYVHMVKGRIYYRKTLSDSGTAPTNAPSKDNEPAPSENVYERSTTVAMRDIESADVSNMTDSSSVELLTELNEKRNIPQIGPWALGGSVLLVILLFVMTNNPVLVAVCASLLGYAVYFAFRRDAFKKTVILLYDFDPTIEQAYANLHASASQLAGCSACWHISASGKVADRKYNAGATELVERKNTSIKAILPSFVKTNIETVAIGVGRQTLYFFPDRLLVFDEGRVGAVAYRNLKVNVSQTRFIENTAPSDARIVDHTWKYVNKDRCPDRRFANNPQLPICLYDEIHFQSSSGLNELIQVSRCGIGETLAQTLQALAQHSTA